MSEEKHCIKVHNEIKDSFNINREVWGTHFSGKRLRIDSILTPKDTTEWKNKNIALGVEFKDHKRIQGDMTNYTKLISQAVDYANTKWDGFGYIPVFIQTDFSVYGDSKEFEFVFPRVLSALGVGQFIKHDFYGWTFYFQGQDIIWCERDGIRRGKYWNLKRTFGSK